ncbi:DNA-directed RNA polymerase subunit alpha C-terminal domain-containing protein [Mannheimia glucosida]|uniref:DNA-directed RNA polymerase subunit alpha C-terminal domain-containing protein n=1 Tax=Mannheimia glucosida TaxID=85401 RepID=UPI0039183A36
MRKIIQICESSMACDSLGDMFNISALCDDGTLWHLYSLKDGWHKYPDIPQDGDKKSPEILSKPIGFLNLKSRTRNILIGASIFYVGDLVKMTVVDVIKLPLSGKKTLMDVESALAEHGLNLGMK